MQFRTLIKKLLRVKNVIIERVYFEEKRGRETLVIRIRQMEGKKAGSGRFDMVVFRAFRPLLPPIYRALKRLLRAGGGEYPGRVLAAYKGRMDNIAGEMRVLQSSLKAEDGPLPGPFPQWRAAPAAHTNGPAAAGPLFGG